MTVKETTHAIVNIFETSAVRGRYGQITVLDDDSGHLTFGRSQTTLGSGNLFHLVKAYCDAGESRYGARLSRYLTKLENRDISLDHDAKLHNLLRATADDPVMIATQDQFFDEHYWQDAVTLAQRQGIESPLGVAVVYDSTIHGSWHYIKRRTNDANGSLATLGEHGWIAAYLRVRRQWLATHRKPILRRTIYRQNTFLDLIDMGLWDLPLPLVVRGFEISTDTLAQAPLDSFSGPLPGERDVRLASPMLHGLDVRQIQLGLSEAGLQIKADGWFGHGSDITLKQWQQDNGLVANGRLEALNVAAFLDQQPSTMLA